MTIALVFFLFAEQTTVVENTGHPTSRCFHSEPQENRLQLSSLSSGLLQLLLLRSGDIESNPGPTPNYEIKIIHLNARSIPKHISDIETECNKYDIITCSETWLAPHHTRAQTDLLHFHPPVRLDRPLNHSGGGVAIYVKRHLFCKHRPDLHVPGLEAIWIETKINKETMLIGSFYRQPSATVDYWDLIRQSFWKVNNTGLKFIAFGDFNSDFNFPSKHLVDILHMFQLHQLTNSDTRITPTSSTCIDLIITQTPQVIKSIEVLPEICSDHCVPCATVINNTNTNYSFKRTLYNYDKLDAIKFCNMLSRIDWADAMQNGSIDDCAEHFNTIFFEAACNCMPVKTVTIRSKDAAWINADIRWAIKQRYRLFKKAKRSNKDEDWRAYRTYRNLVTTKIRDRKLEYLNELDLKASDPKQFGTKEWWKLVKQFMNKKGISDDIPPILFNGTLYSSSEDKANALNDYFIQQSTLDNPNENTPNVEYTDSEITDIILTHADIHSVIKKNRQIKGNRARYDS